MSTLHQTPEMAENTNLAVVTRRRHWWAELSAPSSKQSERQHHQHTHSRQEIQKYLLSRQQPTEQQLLSSSHCSTGPNFTVRGLFLWLYYLFISFYIFHKVLKKCWQLTLMQTTDRFTCVSVMCTIVTPVQFEAAFSVSNSVKGKVSQESSQLFHSHVSSYTMFLHSLVQRVRQAHNFNFLSPEGLCEHLCTLRGLEGMETGVWVEQGWLKHLGTRTCQHLESELAQCWCRSCWVAHTKE